MTEMKHGVDESFSDRLNILRAAVLGANDGIISIAGVVIGVASATPNIWIIFLSGLSAILAGAFSMAGGEYVSVSTQKDTEEAAVNREQALLDRDPKLARESLYHAYLQNGECETSAKILTERAFLKHPLKPWSKRNMVSNTRSLPILGMLLHLASLLFRLVPFLQCSLSFSFQLPIAFR